MNRLAGRWLYSLSECVLPALALLELETLEFAASFCVALLVNNLPYYGAFTRIGKSYYFDTCHHGDDSQPTPHYKRKLYFIGFTIFIQSSGTSWVIPGLGSSGSAWRFRGLPTCEAPCSLLFSLSISFK